LVQIYSFQAHTNAINRIKQLPNGYVATIGNDFMCKIWSPSALNASVYNWTLVLNYTGHTATIFGLDYIDTDTIVTSASDKTIQTWSIATGSTISNISTGGDEARALKMLSNGYYLAAGLTNKNINIYNTNTGTLVSTLIGHSSGLNDLELISSTMLASSAADNSVRIWDLTSNTLRFNLSGHDATVYGLKKVTSSILASVSWDNNVILWDLTSGTNTSTLSNHTNDIFWAVDLLNDNRTLVSASIDKSIIFWDVVTGNVLKKIVTSIQIKALCVLSEFTREFFADFYIFISMISQCKEFIFSLLAQG
jgi:WD40 repeat protein